MASDQPDSSLRPRYNGPLASVVEAIVPFATQIWWLQYNENISKARLQLSVLKKHQIFLQAMLAVWPSLTFRHKGLAAVLVEVRKQQQSKWKDVLLAEEEAAWDRAMARRMLCMFRHLAVGLRSQRPWATELVGGGQGVGKEEKAEEAPDSKEEQKEDFELDAEDTRTSKRDGESWYHWDPEGKLAWRTRGTAKVASSRVFCPPDARPFDCAVACFPDGDEWEIPTVCVSVWKAIVTEQDNGCKKEASGGCSRGRGGSGGRGRGRGKGLPVFWESVTQEGKSLQVKARADRHPLVVLCEDKRMVCGVRVDRLGSECVAGSFAQTIGEKYAAGLVKREKLYELRDEMLLAAAPAPRTMKKPSSTEGQEVVKEEDIAKPARKSPAAHAAGSAQPVKRKRAQGTQPGTASGGGPFVYVNKPVFDAEEEDEEEDHDEYWVYSREMPEFEFDMF